MVRRVFDEFNVDPLSAHGSNKSKQLSSKVKVDQMFAVMRQCSNSNAKNNYDSNALQQSTPDDAE